jgi:alkaline phosphatase
VTTTRLTHATPAAFGAHVPTRFLEDEIARQYIDERDIDVLMGGGRRHFTSEGRDDGRDLIGDAEDAGYQVVETASELEAVDQAPVLGLFNGSHLSMYLDREFSETTQPGLVQMAEKAIELLSQRSGNEGFFLMLEAGRIDHAGHYNDPSILDEQLEGDRATGVCLDFAQDSSTQPTMVVTTADHECGGFSLGIDGIHNTNYELIDQLEASVIEGLKPIIDTAFPSVENYKEILEEDGGIPWEEFDKNLNDRDKFWQFYLGPNFTEQGKIRQRLNRMMQIGFTSFGHTGVDVPLYAEGPNSQFFNTVRDNSDTAPVIADALRITDRN